MSEEEKKLLEELAAVASDYVMSVYNREFAKLNGGRAEQFIRLTKAVNEYEDHVSDRDLD